MELRGFLGSRGGAGRLGEYLTRPLFLDEEFRRAHLANLNHKGKKFQK